jgi:F1F0 ATPase subunit 2
MMAPALSDPVFWSATVCFGLHLGAGLILGLLYFYALWWNARQLARHGRPSRALLLMVGRFVLLGGLLILASLGGALPLLAMTIGIITARAVALMRICQTAP